MEQDLSSSGEASPTASTSYQHTHSLNNDNAPGGGRAASFFTNPPSGSYYDGRGLPQQPVSFEDFEYKPSTSLDFDLFAGLGSSSNPFSFLSPPALSTSAPSPVSLSALSGPIPPQAPLFDESESQLFSSFLNGMDGGNEKFLYNPISPEGMPSPPTVLSDPIPRQAPLFDESESQLFSSFLNGIDGGNENFLFNPILPEGMPSPPSRSMLLDHEEMDRGDLRREVSGLELSESRAGMRKDGEELFSDDGEQDDEDDEDYDVGGDGSNQTRSTSTARGRGGRRTTGKKIKISTNHSSPSSQKEDVEMKDSSASASTPTTATASSRRRMSRSTNSNGGINGGSGNTVASGSTSGIARRQSAARQRASSRAVPLPPLQSSEHAPPTNDFGTANDDEEDQKPILPDVPSPASSSSSTSAPQASPTFSKAPLTDSQKRTNHILSEQKRRNAIRSGFSDLVALLAAGEEASGIVVAAGGGKGRGRGRKGDVGAGASKSVVLEKAGMYVRWLERGNVGLEEELKRVEKALKAGGASKR